MDKKLMQSFRQQLLEMQLELADVEETGADAEQTVELDQTRMGRLSRMDAMQQQAMSKETGRRRRIQLLNIEKALQRISEGEFGECHECGDEINPRRLEVDPTTLLCIDCASSHE